MCFSLAKLIVIEIIVVNELRNACFTKIDTVPSIALEVNCDKLLLVIMTIYRFASEDF